MLNEPDGDSCGATQPPTCCFYRTPNDAEAVCRTAVPQSAAERSRVSEMREI
jgi:hypothetical protein